MDVSQEILSDITIYMKYARYLPEFKRREIWVEICERNIKMHIDRFPELADEIREVYEQFVFTKKVLPSMRSMQFAGKPIEVNPTRIYNCAYLPIDAPEAFAETMFLLLGGTGVGYSVQRPHIDKLPVLQGVLKPEGRQRKKRFLVGDSIEGWADAIKALMESYFYGKKELDFDFRDIRPKGARLITAGGKAPGPEPLRTCIAHITSILENALADRGRGTKLKPIECHDIVCHIADGVLAGGIRRSACLSLFSKDDQEMLYSKSGAWWEKNPQRARANNSACFVRSVARKKDFKEFWEIVKNSGSGEPGIYWTNDPNWGTNPCQPAWATVLTPQGISTIGQIKEGDQIWSEDGWVTVEKKWLTGSKEVFKYATNYGVFYGTQNHRVVQKGEKVEVGNASYIDSLTGPANEYVHPCIDTLPQAKRDELSKRYDVEFTLFNTYEDEEVDCFTSEDRVKLEKLQLELNSNGIRWRIFKTDKDDQRIHDVKKYILHSWGSNSCGWRPEEQDDRVISSELFSMEEVYDITVSGPSHTYWTGGCNVSNCCEIALRPNSFCNLCEINVSDISSQEDLNSRARAAAFIGTLQASYTDYHYLRDIWRENAEKDALLGVSMTGIGSGKVLQYDLKQASLCVSQENERIADIIGINRAARQTCIKPAGTTSLTLGCSSGIHAWHNHFYLRRMRVNKNESIYSYLKMYHPELIEDEYFAPHNTAVIQVPQRAPAGSILRTEPALETLARVKRFSEEWVAPGHFDGSNQHNVSCTISIKDDEWDQIGEWMWANRAIYNGISVLPYDGGTYIQAPFEDITEAEFNRLYKSLQNVDLTKVVEEEDHTDLSGEAACAGGACVLI